MHLLLVVFLIFGITEGSGGESTGSCFGRMTCIAPDGGGMTVMGMTMEETRMLQAYGKENDLSCAKM